jgi:hypothetical protein
MSHVGFDGAGNYLPATELLDIIYAQETEIAKLQELLRGVGANRYWEGRWRDDTARLRALLLTIRNSSNQEFIIAIAQSADANEVEK